MSVDKNKEKMFQIMDEMINKGVGINLSAQIALAIVQEKTDAQSLLNRLDAIEKRMSDLENHVYGDPRLKKWQAEGCPVGVAEKPTIHKDNAVCGQPDCSCGQPTGESLKEYKLSDKDFLNWVKNRLVNVYHESPNTDFIHRLDEIIRSPDAGMVKIDRKVAEDFLNASKNSTTWGSMGKQCSAVEDALRNSLNSQQSGEKGGKE